MEVPPPGFLGRAQRLKDVDGALPSPNAVAADNYYDSINSRASPIQQRLNALMQCFAAVLNTNHDGSNLPSAIDASFHSSDSLCLQRRLMIRSEKCATLRHHSFLTRPSC